VKKEHFSKLTQSHLKRVVANRATKGSIVTMLNIGKAIIPCMWMFGVVHFKDMQNHPIDLCLSISLGVEGSLFGQLGVHH